ncbi:M-phase inducer phosphatase 1-like [Spea bombifrons]|uniref:M-phase inducer phosphatase 1-like n=1 Tax=Spea bombifrons TaxID=233779 RepID=UPI00234A9BD5|nr:M-phase inducer phosphatase 1-like [Spea bombifrons]
MSHVPDDVKPDEVNLLDLLSCRIEPGSSDSSLDEELTFSPDLGLSPVICLPGKMGRQTGAYRLSGISPRRRLKLSPESQSPSPTESSNLPHTTMETATLTGIPNEKTPKLNSHISRIRDSSFEARDWKPKKPARRAKERDSENAPHPYSTKKKSRVKLAELFQSPDCVTGPKIQWSERDTGSGTKEVKVEHPGNRVDPEPRLSMSANSPKCNIADSEDDELIGDFTKKYCLPIEQGKHQDLKYISCATLAKLLTGEYNDVTQQYCVVDCRYPYEFSGGHIKGSKNLYREEQISDHFMKNSSFSQSRNLLIFHCEFSSERAPKLCRALRNLDRNANVYPQLYYPELYILKGGYKEFYENFKSLCEPQGYVNMLHRDFRDHLRQHQRKKKMPVVHGVRKELFKSLSPNTISNPVKTQTSQIDSIRN